MFEENEIVDLGGGRRKMRVMVEPLDREGDWEHMRQEATAISEVFPDSVHIEVWVYYDQKKEEKSIRAALKELKEKLYGPQRRRKKQIA